MQGTVLAVDVEDGEVVHRGAVLLVVEAMKMENEIVAPHDGVVAGLAVGPGDAVTAGQIVCLVEPAQGADGDE